MNMNRADLAVEILPRALWVLQGVCLFLGIRLTDGHSIGTDDIIPAVLGIVLVIVGLLFLAYSFYWIRHALISKDLVTDGPFGYMRHPMYISVYIMLLGIGLVLSSWVWFAIMVAFLPVWYVDCRIEERQMIDLHGERHLKCMRRTGMFLPRVNREVTSRA